MFKYVSDELLKEEVLSDSNKVLKLLLFLESATKCGGEKFIEKTIDISFYNKQIKRIFNIRVKKINTTSKEKKKEKKKSGLIKLRVVSNN